MNVIKEIAIQYPLDKMYVPSGWMVSKNNLVDIGVEILNLPEYSNDYFLIKENFFSSCIFYSINECFISGIYFKCVIDVGCSLSDSDVDNFIYKEADYEITFSLYKGKSKKDFYDFYKKVKNRYDMITEVNFLMNFFSSIVIDFVEDNGFNANLNHLMENSRVHKKK